MSSSKPSFLSVLPFLVLPPLFWAGNFAVGRAVREDIAPFTLSFGRWVIALIVLLPFVIHYMRRDWELYKENITKIIAVSLVGVAGFNTLVYKGLHSTTTTNAILLNSCIPVLIMLIGALFYQQRLRFTQLLGLLISLSGVLSIVLHGDWSRLLSFAFNPGDLIVFFCDDLLGTLYAMDERYSCQYRSSRSYGSTNYFWFNSFGTTFYLGN